MTSIFISYSRKDKDAADYIANELRARGADVFIDYEDIPPGDEFPLWLSQEVINRDCFVLLVSPNSVVSKWVKREVNWADKHNKKIIPLLMENTEIPDELDFIIHSLQRIDFIDWDINAGTNPAISKLAKALNLSERSLQASIETNDEKGVRELSGHNSSVHSVTFTSDGLLLASGSTDGEIRLWNISDQVKSTILSAKNQHDVMFSLAVSSNSSLLASAFLSGVVQIWEITHVPQVRGWQISALLGEGSMVHSVAFSPEDRLIACGSADCTINLWELGNHQIRTKLIGHISWVYCVAFGPDGLTLASGSGDGTVRLWDVIDQHQIAVLEGHEDAVNSVAFASNGRSLVSGSSDGTIRLWDIESKRQQAELRISRGSVTALAFSRDGTLLASGASDGTVRLWGLAL